MTTENISGIITTANRYRSSYPDWSRVQALEIAISEYDSWGEVTAGRINYDELLARVK